MIFSIKVYLIGKTESDTVEKIFGFIMIVLMVLGLINSLLREQLNGKLNGEIIFDYEKIVIGEDNYYLADIRQITIDIRNYKGQLISSDAGFWEMFSNGINNELTMILNSEEVIKCYFQINYKREIVKANKELRNYVDEGKLLKKNYFEITS
ncbi:hypothetical protein D3C86_1590320 [compost metagenome]